MSLPHTHNCAATACQKQIPLNLLMCMTHWRMVPAPLARAVKDAWRTRLRRPGNPDAIAAHEAKVVSAVVVVHAKQFRKIADKAAGSADLFE